MQIRPGELYEKGRAQEERALGISPSHDESIVALTPERSDARCPCWSLVLITPVKRVQKNLYLVRKRLFFSRYDEFTRAVDLHQTRKINSKPVPTPHKNSR
jgi:hypothetical protein